MAKLDQNQRYCYVRVGPQGRIVIPAHIRQALGIHPGQTLVARIEDGRLVLETREQILVRVQSWFAQVPREVSLVDELIAERREEARREAEG
jgi:AbrB family looped-hinge helix DNA binding protein